MRRLYPLAVLASLLLALPASASTPGAAQNEQLEGGDEVEFVAGRIAGDSGELTQLQYELFPYPPLPPEATVSPLASLPQQQPPLVLHSPSHLVEMNHYLWRGERTWCDEESQIRILIAGGGTGAKTEQLVAQLEDMAAAYEVVHLDLSSASLRAAKERLQRRSLVTPSVRFVHGSILQLPSLQLGLFDYIDCLGVLHHMAEPSEGLRALAAALRPGGGMGLMFYGELGRLGIYHAQDMLRLMLASQPDATEEQRIALARRLLSALPPSNWLRKDAARWLALQTGMAAVGDSGLVDTLLPAADVAYRVSEIVDMLEAAQLRVVQLLQPALYEPSSYTRDDEVLRRVQGMSKLQRAAFAELLAGNIGHHFLYVARAGDATVGEAEISADSVVVLFHYDGPSLAQLLEDSEPRLLFRWRKHGMDMSWQLPAMAPAILRAIDGRTKVAALYALVTAEDEWAHASWQQFMRAFRRLYSVLHGINKMYLSSAQVKSHIVPQAAREMAPTVPHTYYIVPRACHAGAPPRW